MWIEQGQAMTYAVCDEFRHSASGQNNLTAGIDWHYSWKFTLRYNIL